ncbi:hypothetical protein RJ640_026534 [Escallonia rubra]|uniref:RING-type E3 ubiquitin transferase n=1 Tax=Escallonia rubra TaxID=112253 RepID=A0AA88R0Y0_9ASTE|nr:hypothetical protein RJ640_026534 [Escallonia rubra]
MSCMVFHSILKLLKPALPLYGFSISGIISGFKIHFQRVKAKGELLQNAWSILVALEHVLYLCFQSIDSLFRVGHRITSVRLLPHAYDLYRAHSYGRSHFDGSYIYANPTSGFYSAAWDVIIPLGGVILAMIVYLQQRFGGRSIITQVLVFKHFLTAPS